MSKQQQKLLLKFNKFFIYIFWDFYFWDIFYQINFYASDKLVNNFFKL